MQPLAGSREKGQRKTPGTRLVRALFAFFFFVSYTILYLTLIASALAKYPELRKISTEYVPVLENFVPGFSYVGFFLPLGIAATASMLLLFTANRSSLDFKASIKANKSWIIGGVASVASWYFVPGFASGGHTDFPFAVLASICAGWKWNNKNPKRSILGCIVLGFGIGLVSDLQSQTFFVGIFGGWGFLDGDLLGTIVLPVAAVTAAIVMRFVGDNRQARQPVQANLGRDSAP